jgi:outer membrane protein OmpA-like peptidoglycan-associated protein
MTQDVNRFATGDRQQAVARRWRLVIAAAIVAAATLPATAAEFPSSVDAMVQFFSAQEATRGICIGGEAECGPSDKKPLDLNLVIGFEKDSAILTGEAKSNLDILAAALKTPSLSVASFAIEGHADASGTDEYNQDLSTRRAQSVMAYLKRQGVDIAKLRAKGFGETQPIAGDDPYDPANRRVEIRLILQ